MCHDSSQMQVVPQLYVWLAFMSKTYISVGGSFAGSAAAELCYMS